VLDNSPLQLEQDQFFARRDGLSITSILGDMRDLSQFPSEFLDLVFNPCSMSFVSDPHVVCRQSDRVLKRGFRLLCGLTNPAKFIFDEDKLAKKQFEVRHQLPYSDTTHLSTEESQKLRSENEPFM